jgi:hypothetical protein
MALIAAVALIRTVGHVLKKVDAAQNPAMMESVSRRFEEWKRDREKARVFWEFVDAERNSILKEYDFRFDFAPIVTTAESTTHGGSDPTSIAPLQRVPIPEKTCGMS